MTVAAYLDKPTFDLYVALRKQGLIEVLATDPETERHAVEYGGLTEPRAMTTSELVELIITMASDGDDDSSDKQKGEEVKDEE